MKHGNHITYINPYYGGAIFPHYLFIFFRFSAFYFGVDTKQFKKKNIYTRRKTDKSIKTGSLNMWCVHFLSTLENCQIKGERLFPSVLSTNRDIMRKIRGKRSSMRLKYSNYGSRFSVLVLFRFLFTQ